MKRMLWAVLLILLAIAGVQAAETPSPALLVLNKEENTLAIVDPATKMVVGRVPTGEAPHEVTVSADGGWLSWLIMVRETRVIRFQSSTLWHKVKSIACT